MQNGVVKCLILSEKKLGEFADNDMIIHYQSKCPRLMYLKIYG